jgi:translocation and assembly module TamA
MGAVPAMAAKNVDVNINGIHGDLRTNVQALLSIIQDYPKKQPPPDVVRMLYNRAPAEIKTALQPYGYYQPKIKSSLKRNDGGWLATFNIHHGPPTRISAVDIRVTGPGKHSQAVQNVLKQQPFKVGQRLVQTGYDSFKSSLLEAAHSDGYLDAQYKRHEIAVHPEHRQAQIHLVLTTGQQYYFGPIRIQQNFLAPSFVQKYVDIKPGQVFQSNKLLNLRLKLRNSSYFNQINVQAEKGKAVNHRIPVLIKASPSPGHRYLFSVGYGTDTGPRAHVGLLFRHLNRYGHTFRADLQVSLIQQALTAQYKIPIGDITSEYLDFSATGQQLDIADYKDTELRVGSSLNQNAWGGRRRIALDYAWDKFSFGSEPHRISRLLMPSLQYQRKRANNLLFPRKGYSITVDIRGAGKPALSSASFVRGDLDARTVYPLDAKSRFLFHAELGAVGTNEFRALPPTQRFFTGGARTLRGFGYQYVGSIDSHGQVIGGKYLSLASAEVDRLVWGNFGLAAFYDAGTASTDSPFSDIRTDVGLGIRYKTPVGMVRLDFGHPLRGSSRLAHIQLSIGPDL